MKLLGKLTRALIALAVLAAIVVGLPAALVTFGTSPLRGSLSTDSLQDALAEPTSDHVIAGLLTVAAWLVWALFVRALVAEVAAAARSRRRAAAEAISPLPATKVGPLRWLARSMVLWLTMTAGSVGSLGGAGATVPALSAVLAVEHTQAAAAAPFVTLVAPALTPAPAVADARPGRHITVEEPTDAWTLAERHLGSGLRWQELWAHNRDQVQPDGQRWEQAEAPLEPGWKLYLPGPADTSSPAPAAPAAPALATPVEEQVVEGDDFWSLAEQQLAVSWGRAPTPAEITPYWQQVVEANRDRLAPPGDPNLIFPGQTFELPPAGPDPLAPAVAPAPAPSPTPSEPASPTPTPDPAPAPGDPRTEAPAPAPVPAPEASVPAPSPSASTQQTGAPATPTTAPAATPGASPISALADHTWPVGLAAGGVALAGAVVLLDRRRRAQQRHRPRGHRLPTPPPGMERCENELRSGVDITGARLVDVALRAAAAGSGTTGLPALRWVELDTTSVLLVLADPSPPPAGFTAEAPDRWRTSSDSEALARAGSQVVSPAPTLVPVGVTPDGIEILVDLETSGVVTVSGPPDTTAGFMRALATAAATIPWNPQPQILLAGMSGELCALPWVNAAVSLGDALAAAEVHVSRIAATLRDLDCGTAGQARASGEIPDSWDPLIVISAQQPHELDDRRLAGIAARPQHAVAVVTPPGAVPLQGRAFTLDDTGLLRIDGVEVVMQARLLDEGEARVVIEILERATDLDATVPAPSMGDEAVRVAPDPGPPPDPEQAPGHRLDELLAGVEVLVRVMGEIEVTRLSATGEEPLTAERQKGLEALVYMALRESAVDRDALQAALFPTGANAVKTFHNTMSAARATVGEGLLPHSSSGRYELSDRVVTDYGLFYNLVGEAEDSEDPEVAAGLLHEALSLIRGEPFTGVGRGYSWVSSHCGMIVAQVVDAAEELAEVSLATGDRRTAEWAARQGLAAFPCDERMYRILMRTAKAAGNLPGVRRAFRELCDALADPDTGVEPIDTVHPETVALLEELTRTDRSRMGA